ncbi:MAG: PEP-CTERM sorting domain-containing protein [Burkholderiales bacterium]|nr:PEP-CTERM sorting domain-containing protein [Burkholderiales bacterium]
MRHANLLKLACFIAIGGASTCATAATQLAFDTLGPADAYITGLGWGVGGGSVNGPTGANYAPANRFMAQSTGFLASATAAITHLQGSPFVSFNLHSDNNGAPGAILASAIASAPDAAGLVTTSYANGPEVVAGAFYWFSIATDDLSAAHLWHLNAQGTEGLTAFTGATWQSPGDWFYQSAQFGAFRVSVDSTIPEPSTALLLAAGLLAVARKGRRAC